MPCSIPLFFPRLVFLSPPRQNTTTTLANRRRSVPNQDIELVPTQNSHPIYEHFPFRCRSSKPAWSVFLRSTSLGHPAAILTLSPPAPAFFASPFAVVISTPPKNYRLALSTALSFPLPRFGRPGRRAPRICSSSHEEGCCRRRRCLHWLDVRLENFSRGPVFFLSSGAVASRRGVGEGGHG